MLAAVLLPLHHPAYHIDTSALGPTIVLLVEEIMISAVLGLTARLTISALEVAGFGDRPATTAWASLPPMIRPRASQA